MHITFTVATEALDTAGKKNITIKQREHIIATNAIRGLQLFAVLQTTYLQLDDIFIYSEIFTVLQATYLQRFKRYIYN